MISREELALNIGMSILKQINKFQSEKKDFGQDLIIPFKFPSTSGRPDFTHTVKLGMPRFSQINPDGSITHFTMAEYYGWGK